MRVGTRGSALALAQARWVAERLPGEAELVEITTSGDRGRGGDKARFVKEIEEALLAGEVDLAVHSAKDVPSKLPAGLAIVGVPERADARDALCGGARSLDELEEGAVVGTSSPRRRAALLALRADLDVRALRGNVDTRLRRLERGEFDALLLARAGLERLGRGSEGVPVAPDRLVPAAGQGCLALEARADDDEARAAAAAITDPNAVAALTAERALVAALEADCRTPVAAHAAVRDGDLSLSAFAAAPEGDAWVSDRLSGAAGNPAALGRELGARMLAAGAADVIASAP